VSAEFAASFALMPKFRLSERTFAAAIPSTGKVIIAAE